MEEKKKSKAAPSEEKESANGLALGLSLGTAMGAALGSALGNLAIGVSMGISLGLCLGLAIDRSHGKKKAEDAPEKPEGSECEE